MSIEIPPKIAFWKTQKPVDYLDTTLVINTWEEIKANLSAGKPVKLWYIILIQTNNGATAETIELEITINGTVYTWSVAADSGTTYYCVIGASLTGGDFTAAVVTTSNTVGNEPSDYEAVPFIAENVSLIRVRQTTNVDITTAQIEVNIIWEKLTAVEV